MNRVHQHKKLSLQNFFYLYLISTAFIFASPVQGQIIPDNTLGTEASRLNPNQMIHGVLGDKIDGGARRGSNLFHSFQEFNIETGHRVYIANPAGIANILTRVTGRSPSEIFGTLGVLGNANLYLLNPNGILFGPNAQLDISGSFVANTANSFTFPDGSQFSTTTPKSPPLLNVNVPLGLQYGSSRTGATITNRGDLRSGQDLQLIADKLDLQGQLIAGRDLVLQAQNMVKVRDTALNPFVARSGGNLIIQGNQGIDIFAFSHPQQMAFISGKNLSLLSDGPISGDAHFSSGGDFRIQSLSGHLVNFTSLYDPIISSTGNVDIAAHYSGASLLIESQENVRIQGAVTIDAPDTVSPFVGEDAALRTQPGLIIRSGQNSLVYGGTSQNSPSGFTSGAVPAGITLLSPVRMQPNTQGGLVKLTANQGGITFHSIDASSTTGGNGGTIDLRAAGEIKNTSSFLDPFGLFAALGSFSYTIAGDSGNGGDISLISTLGNITLNNVHSYSYSYSASGNVGSGGNISFSSDSGNITLNNSVLNSNAQSDSDNAGSGGNISFKTGSGDITLNNTPSFSYSYSPSGNAGSGGNISFKTSSGDITLTHSPSNSVSQSNSGHAETGGNISFNASSGDITLNSSPLALYSYSGSGSLLPGGNISLETGLGDITLNNSSSSSSSYGKGNAGDILIKAGGRVLFTNESIIRSTVEVGAIGDAGNINIGADSLLVSNGAQINSDVLGIGKGGNINVNVRNDITIRGKDTAILNSLGRPEYKQSIGEGKAGDINITGGSLRLEDGARIDSGTSGQGNGGNINVNIRDAVVLDGISSQTPTAIKSNVEQFAQGDAGDVTITAKSISITNGALLESRTRGNGYAGNITIMVSDLALFDEGTDYNRFNDPQSGMEYYGSSGVYSSVSRGAIGQGGNITIKANAVSLASDAQISSSTSGQGDAGSIAINTPTINFLSNSSKVTASTATSSKGGRISIDQFYPISISGPGQLTVETTGTGKAGDITISADQGIILSNGSQLSALTSSNGGAGSITLNTSALTIAGNAQILATTERDGQGGSITINAPTSVNLMRVQDSAPVLSVETSGAGKAGDITINTPTLRLSEAARITATATESATNLQGGGSITLNTSNLDLAGIVGVFAETQGKSPAGDLRLNPYDNQPDLKVTLTRNSQISASTSGSGQGGDLIVTAPQSITIAGSGKLAVETNSIGNAGNMNFTTRQLILKDGVEISASTSGIGKAGEIGINAETFSLNGGAKISTNTSNSGAAGNLNIQARDQIFLTGQDTGLFASTDEGSTGKGGSIIIDPRTFIIRDGATISTNSQGEGTGGDIKLSAGSLNLDNGKISAATGSSNGGNITLNVQDLLLLRNGSQISTTAGDDQAGGNGGNITVDGKFIVAIPHEDSNISANAFTGTGGNIQINAQGIFGIESRAEPTDQSDITASSEQGISGIINLNTPDNSSIQNSFTQLSPNVIDTNALIANSCIARGTKRQENSFTITGSGALRNSPGDVLISAYTTGDVRSVESTSRPWKKGDPIIEPQGLYRLPDGRLLLSRAC
ncbi:filamentous hemagglutinin N-terminal domain-containing protein [Nostoc sp. FACHB-152]|uniref:two-partner secretion domain-containing protein n=1 Tax=Nostoc sp. FACHB-152 TaxID=2692837 RepID=UPI0016859031|nr:filamentous hemagglutinin N-terminal domain-containing protein [Nostoc sp. FACHB-152]MBD2451593.1 filamentous hemagglutinin N-terminal domain-containing protein [Nostoc sp. FACHB-152]